MMLEEASRWLAEQAMENLSVTVTYRFLDGGERVIRAVPGRTLFRTADSYGMAFTTESRDFIVTAGELREEPQRGDTVLWNGRTYEVLSMAGEPCWRWCGSYCTAKRIHTKEAGMVEEP